jgi:hypothetical protein
MKQRDLVGVHHGQRSVGQKVQRQMGMVVQSRKNNNR